MREQTKRAPLYTTYNSTVIFMFTFTLFLCFLYRPLLPTTVQGNMKLPPVCCDKLEIGNTTTQLMYLEGDSMRAHSPVDYYLKVKALTCVCDDGCHTTDYIRWMVMRAHSPLFESSYVYVVTIDSKLEE